MKYKLSPSTLNIFTECRRCFWLQFNKGIKRPQGIFPSLPSGMDSMLKRHFDKYMEKGLLPPELSSLKDVRLFDDKEKLRIWRSNFKGIQYEEDGHILRGAVDNILVKEDKLIVLDYKTRGYPLKENTHEHYIQQMDIYNFLLRKKGYKTEDYTYLIFYHPEDINEKGDVIFHKDLIRIKTEPKRAEKLWKEAIICLEGEEPKASEGCDYCKYRNS